MDQKQDARHEIIEIHPYLYKILAPLLGLDRIEDLYTQIQKESASAQKPLTPQEFCRIAIEKLDCRAHFPDKLKTFSQIKGPLLVVANHNLGALDALVLIQIMSKIRPAYKFVINETLLYFSELREVLLPASLNSNKASLSKNISLHKNVLRALDAGQVVGVFPAGRVALKKSLFSKSLQELQWTEHVGRWVQKTQATVIPIAFESQNSALFSWLGLLAPQLRLALLAREMLNFKNNILYKVGAPITYEDLSDFRTPKEISLELQTRTLKLLKSP